MRHARLATAATALLVALSGLTVAAPAYAAPVGSAAPSTLPNDGAKSFVVTASGFYPASQEEVVLRPSPAVGGQADLTTTVTNVGACTGGVVLPNADCGDKLSVAVTTTNAQPGTYDVVETQTESGLSPTTRTRLIAVVTVLSQPRFTSLTPTSAGQGGRSIAVTLVGTGFAQGLTATFGDSVTVSDVRVQSPTEATASLTIAPTATQGPRDVVLTSLDALSATAAGAFTVNLGPVITQVAPSSVLRGEGTALTVTGVGFSRDAVLTINGASLTNVAVNAEGTTVTADLATAATTPYGPRAVRIRNNDGGETALDGGFSLLAPPGLVSGLTAVPGDGAVTLSWTAPADPGSSPVTGYTVTAAGVARPVTGTTFTLGGLANGTEYRFDVVAGNADSSAGPASTVSATPQYVTRLALATVSTVTYGSERTIRGSLLRISNGFGVAGVPVTLTYTPRLGPPIMRQVTTDASGRFSSAVRATYTTVVTAAFAGRTEDVSATSAPLTSFVAARVSVVAPTSGSVTPANRVLTVVGSVGPNKAGRAIGLYYGTRLVGRAVIASNGSFRIPVTLPRGNYRLQVKIAATPGNVAGTSPAFIVSRR